MSIQVTIIVFELSARDISSRDRKLYSRAVDTTAPNGRRHYSHVNGDVALVYLRFLYCSYLV